MATGGGISNVPAVLGATLGVSAVLDLANLSVDGFTLGTICHVRGTGEQWVLAASTASVDHTTVEAVSGYSNLRWLVSAAGAASLTGDVTGTLSGTAIATTLVKVGGVTITGTGTSLMTSASASAARTTLGVDILKAGTALTDADQTIQPATDASSSYTQAATLTADRTKTLGTTSVVSGTIVQIIRRDTAAHSLIVVNGGGGGGTLFTFASGPATAQEATFAFDGTNWSFLNFGYVA